MNKEELRKELNPKVPDVLSRAEKPVQKGLPPLVGESENPLGRPCFLGFHGGVEKTSVLESLEKGVERGLPWQMVAPTVFLSVLALVEGIFPTPLFNWVARELSLILGGGL